MKPQRFALIAGLLFFITGILSFVDSLQGDSSVLKPLLLNTYSSNFLGVFPMNVINKVALLLFGAFGIFAAASKFRALSSSVAFARLVALVMIPGAILGLFPSTDTIGGYWPLYGGEVALHGIFGLLGAYYGFRLPMKARSEIKPLLSDVNKDRSRRAA